MNTRVLRLALRKFDQSGGTVTSSRFTAAQRRALDQFCQDTGCIRAERKGAGILYRMVNPSVFQQHLTALQPLNEQDLAPALNNRARNIAITRSSKAGSHQHKAKYQQLKAIGPDVHWRNDTDYDLDLSRLTHQLGGAIIDLSDPNNAWSTTQPLWLVENQALFDQTDWLPPHTQATLTWYPGQLCDTLQQWLAARQRAPQIVLFPDYDGVGLQNWIRLLRTQTGPCEFWLMPDWQAKLHRYGDPTLWEKTARYLPAVEAELNQLRGSAELIELIRQLKTTGLALEQEAVWL